MFRIFIERPVLSTVISAIIVLLGVLGLSRLPIAQYPDIAPPTVVVNAVYSGGNTDVVLNSVIVPLEQQINGVEGMIYMTSTATSDGVATITVYFALGTDPNIATVNVQNRVSAATNLLPAAVIQAGVTVRKTLASNLLILSLYTDEAAYDQTFLQNYAAINLTPQLQRVSGVGGANVLGALKTYSMRIWLRPDVMAIYGLTPADVTAALNDQNVDAAPGQFGQNDNQSFQYVIQYSGRLISTGQYGNVIIRTGADGRLIRLKDIARIELGSQTYTSASAFNGKPAVGIVINQTPGSNASQVINDCKAVVATAQNLLPPGVHIDYLVDINQFLDAAINGVVSSLLTCFGLVFLVIFIFLQDFRSTIIHGVSVPVSIVGTFFFLNLLGFSINLLTLFALVLAIGIVVDDAIVVVEAVHAKLESGYTSARQAAIDAMSEISGVIIAITLVMASVFLPVTFISGSAGVFYQQFGITLAVAIFISAVNALTLCPALAALFLKPLTPKTGPPGTTDPLGRPAKKSLMERFKAGFDKNYAHVQAGYAWVVTILTARKWLAFALVAGFSAAFYVLFTTTPTSFVPKEDMGIIFVNISLPPASSLERTAVIANQVDAIARTIPQVQSSLRNLGQNFISGSGSGYALLVLRLIPWDKRPGVTDDDIITLLKQKTAAITEASLVYIQQPTITGFGTNGGFTVNVQDKGAHSTDAFYKVTQAFLADLRSRPEIQYATTSFDPTFPQYRLDVNVAKCKQAGLLVSDILNAMQVFYGSAYIANFNEFGQQYRVIVQADTNYRASPAGLSRIAVRTTAGSMAPITEFITLTRTYGPQVVSRFNLFTAMSVNGSPNPGFSTGQALLAIQASATKALPPGYGFAYAGISREENNASQQIVYVFLLCLVFVYLLLSAQYESYLVPFAVLLPLPIGLTGVLVFARLFGFDNNIYLQISLIMLIGLLAKNAILIVEFAIERRRAGMDLLQSAMEGGKARLRPILMTSLAFIFGLLPLMFATGAGAQGNRSIGTGAIGGMLFGTLLGVLVIPTLYVVFQGLQEKISGPPAPALPQPAAGDNQPPGPASHPLQPVGA